jgi:hypothetical protein
MIVGGAAWQPRAANAERSEQMEKAGSAVKDVSVRLEK